MIRACLEAAANGPFFDDVEIRTLLGVDREEIESVLSRWPDVDATAEDVLLAINNSMANLLGYPHGLDGDLLRLVGFDSEEIEAAFETWKC